MARHLLKPEPDNQSRTYAAQPKERKIMDPNQKLKRLQDKKDQIEARIKNIEASEQAKAKKEDTRRKILIGAFYMEQMAKIEEVKTKVLAYLDGFLTRPMDRKLFGLSERPHIINQPGEQTTGEKNDADAKKPPQRKAG